MAKPVGEDSWLAYLEEAARNATDIEQRVQVVELHKHAVSAEPGSLRLWLACCNYFWALWTATQSADAGWSEQDQIMGRELFSFGAALDLWQRGYKAVKYRLDDSHRLWDRWLSLEMEQLAKTKTPEGIRRITHLYRDRLSTPHLTWDHTSQAFSSFLSEYNPNAWEETMKEVTASAQQAKQAIAARDHFELRLKGASTAGSIEAHKTAMRDYVEWEVRQTYGKSESAGFATDLCCGLFDRALTSVFTLDDELWLEYIVFVSSPQTELQAPEKLLEILRRAVQHCPWSGKLWDRYILCAEEARLPFSDIESIKHSATSENQLYKNGMEGLIDVYVAWCGFLKRTALEATATDEAVDVADVGLRAALEDVAVVGKRLYGKEFQGDPKFRLERIYIQYLTEKKGAVDEARVFWNKLADVRIHADNHDFWLAYYTWEMRIFSSSNQTNRSPTPSSSVSVNLRTPKIATAVLHAGVSRKTVDWPEKVLEVYLQHCNDYELPASVRRAADMANRVGKVVRRRRQREEEKKAAAYATYYGAQQSEQVDAEAESPNGTKRKLEALRHPGEDDAESTSKRPKLALGAAEPQISQSVQQGSKRDREHATILVTGLPGDITHTKLRQYFKEYGHINNITAFIRENDGQSSTAMIEFSCPEEAQSALLRDGKYFGQSQLSVQSGQDLTVYVTNYPPVADERYMRRLFKDCGDILSIRWPSLKINTHRRFCYISFRDQGASAKAVAKEGTILDGKYSLVVKFSDPSRKKAREGAVAEGREVYITGLDKSVVEDEIRGLFAKLGTVTRVNIPMTLAGKNRGFAYVDFESKEQAQKAVDEMNNTKFRHQILSVEMSKEMKVKHASKTMNRDLSSAPDALMPSHGQWRDDAGSEGGSSPLKPCAEDITARTIALMGFHDTVNDARVRALVEPLGALIQLVVQPAHGGAKIEFVDTATAGKAALQLDGMDFEGRKLRIGTLDELHRTKAERTEDRIVHGAGRYKKAGKGTQPATASAQTALMPLPSSVRALRRGRSGQKRGIGFAPRWPAGQRGPRTDDEDAVAGDDNSKRVPKTNADFKSMFLGSSSPCKEKGVKADDADALGGGRGAGGGGAGWTNHA